jgi:PTS system cellobiose-specific IIC component
MLPWSTPLLISGLMVGGIKGLLVQLLILVISTVIYFPFFKMQDNIAYKNEQALEA